MHPNRPTSFFYFYLFLGGKITNNHSQNFQEFAIELQIRVGRMMKNGRVLSNFARMLSIFKVPLAVPKKDIIMEFLEDAKFLKENEQLINWLEPDAFTEEMSEQTDSMIALCEFMLNESGFYSQ